MLKKSIPSLILIFALLFPLSACQKAPAFAALYNAIGGYADSFRDNSSWDFDSAAQRRK